MAITRVKRISGYELGVAEPPQFWAPWVGHWYPGITPDRMAEVDIGQFIGMWEFVNKRSR